jgi:hypothetical protein
MDKDKKVAFEKKAVLVLAGVFVIVLVVGPLKSLGILHWPSARAPAPLVDQVQLTGSLGELIQQQRAATDVRPDPGATGPAAGDPQLLGPVLYAAGDLRDPLASLLAKPAPVTPEPGVATPEEGPRLVMPPPTLTIQGLVWGGPEPQAIIDGRVYRVNDMIQGGRVTAIDRRGVTVDFHGATLSYAPASSRLGGAEQAGP